MATHSSVLAWRIPGTGELGGLPLRECWAGTQLNSCCCCCVASVVSDSVRSCRQQPTRLPRPWDSPGKNTGVGCHFLLQCMKVKSESEVAQSCLTLSNPMDLSLPGSSIHGIFQARVLEWGAIAFSEYSPTLYEIRKVFPGSPLLTIFLFLWKVVSRHIYEPCTKAVHPLECRSC